MITEKEEIIQEIKKLKKSIKDRNKKVDKLIHEIECMTLAFIEHYSLNRQMIHTKSVKMRTDAEHKERLSKTIKE
tara:strand:- start:2177 stop:2401 length:225 start_codon:yes stop_codon:yes gene_type:complete